MNNLEWLIQIKAAIQDISDINWQKKAWLGEFENIISSPDEIVMRLIDDLCFEEFITKLSSEELSLLKHLEEVMSQLYHMLMAYDTTNLSELDILEDLQWLNITLQAKKIIEQWNKEN